MFRYRTLQMRPMPDSILSVLVPVGVNYYDWIEGSNTVMTITNGVVRITSTNGSDPRASLFFEGLQEDWTYIVRFQARGGTGNSSIYRVSADSDLTLADYGEVTGITGEQEVEIVFSGPASGEVYVGFIEDVSSSGQYGECDAELIYFGRGDPVFDINIFDNALFDVFRGM